MSHCFTWDNAMEHTAFQQEKPFALLGMCLAGWKAAVHGQGRNKGVRCLQEMLIQGVDEGPKLFSMESDGWEQPRRGLSTHHILLLFRPDREWLSLPEAAVVVVNVRGWKHTVSGN